MPDRYTPEEFGQLMKPWASEERSIAMSRMKTMYRRERLETFSVEEAVLLEEVLAILIPQNEGIDLVGFLDEYADSPLGRGDKPPGLPQGAELIRQGLKGLKKTFPNFLNDDRDRQEAALRSIQEGKHTWGALPSSHFFQVLLRKALHGYYSHPLVWMRIGFPGASYPEGYSWVGVEQVKARHDRKPGWDLL